MRRAAVTLQSLVLGLCLVAAGYCGKASAGDEPEAKSRIRMTGFLRSRTAESIRPPATEEWSFNIMMLVPEGSRVQAGDVVARLEGERLKQRLSEATNQLLQAKVKAEQKTGELKTQIEDLRKLIADDERELALLETGHAAATGGGEWARAARDLLGEKLDIEAKKMRLTLERDKLRRKERLLATVEAAMEKNVQGAAMRVDKSKDAIAQGERKTSTGGIVVYKRTPWERQKVRVGGSVHRGSDVLAIVDDKDLYVEAFLREEDWRWVKVGSRVGVRILGRRERSVHGEVQRLSAIVMKAGDWDRTLGPGHPLFERRVFRLEVKLDAVPDEAKPDGEVELQLAGGGAT